MEYPRPKPYMRSLPRKGLGIPVVSLVAVEPSGTGLPSILGTPKSLVPRWSLNVVDILLFVLLCFSIHRVSSPVASGMEGCFGFHYYL